MVAVGGGWWVKENYLSTGESRTSSKLGLEPKWPLVDNGFLIGWISGGAICEESNWINSLYIQTVCPQSEAD